MSRSASCLLTDMPSWLPPCTRTPGMQAMVAAVWQERYVTRLAVRLLRAWRRHVRHRQEEPTSLCSLRTRLRARGFAGERDVRRRWLQRCALAALAAPFAEPRRCVSNRTGRKMPLLSLWNRANAVPSRSLRQAVPAVTCQARVPGAVGAARAPRPGGGAALAAAAARAAAAVGAAAMVGGGRAAGAHSQGDFPRSGVAQAVSS